MLGRSPSLYCTTTLIAIVVSHIQRYQPKKVLNTVANPARGLLNREMYTVVYMRYQSFIPSYMYVCTGQYFQQSIICNGKVSELDGSHTGEVVLNWALV